MLNYKGIYIFHLVPNTILTHAAGLDSLLVKGDVILTQAINGIKGSGPCQIRELQWPFFKPP